MYDDKSDTFYWLGEKDDSVGTGCYNSLKAAQKHFNVITSYVNKWKRGVYSDISSLNEDLRNEYKFLSKNDTRLTRASEAIRKCEGVRILEYDFPSVVAFVDYAGK